MANFACSMGRNCLNYSKFAEILSGKMKIAVYIGKKETSDSGRLKEMFNRLEAGGCEFYDVKSAEEVVSGTDMMMAIGGDGTFLSSASIVGYSEIPLLGVNVGRLGFLSEHRPEDIAEAILSGNYVVEERSLLSSRIESGGEVLKYRALNEMTVHRNGAAMLGVDIRIDGAKIPTYWADGLIVSTASGSTAYSLSVGGPIVVPGSKVLIISPIAPHNLNVRPMIVPDSSKINLTFIARDNDVIFTADNSTEKIPSDASVKISLAQFSLKRVSLRQANFFSALTDKLHWGEDVRNTNR